MKDNFIDSVTVFCKSGNGGSGIVHFYRGRNKPKGGPDGGNGGLGGSIYIKATRHSTTLYKLVFQKHIIAQNGNSGQSNNKNGKDGEDVYIEVPVGTIAYNNDNNEQICEVLEDNQTELLLKGGKGGLGNSAFKRSTLQAPKFSQSGISGIEKNIRFELKLMADVGLIGLPNAGKSTLLSVLSRAKPKIANYPFTTIKPSIGVVYHKEKSFVMSDLPGIIKNAHLGAGMGIRFLKHIERNGVLIFLISAEEKNINETYKILQKELFAFNPELELKDRLLVISKVDLISTEKIKEIESQTKKTKKIFISSLSNTGLIELKNNLIELLYETFALK